MADTFSLLVVFSLLGSIGGMCGAAALLLFPEPTRRSLLPSLLGYATGTLLAAAAFLGMIPKGVAQAPALNVSATVLAGIVVFFLMEKIVVWRHCHAAEYEVHGEAGPLILFGDGLHNFVDGLVIAAAFVTSIPLGIAASFAVIAHEVPQEVGDFAILLDSGYSRRRAFALNLLSSLTTLPGALAAYFYLATASHMVPYILALSAASFIYVAMADLVPTMHQTTGLPQSLRQLLCILLGIATIAFFRFHG
jgi:zinc and cadmium transporter